MFTHTTSTLSATFTQTDLYNALKTALTGLGMTVYDEYTSGGSPVVVVQVVANGTATGTIYAQYIVGTTNISQAVATAWNTGTHSATGGSTSAGAFSYVTTSNVDFHSFVSNQGEGKFLILRQSGVSGPPFGWMRPANKPDWIDEATYSYIFYSSSTTFANFVNRGGALTSPTMSSLGYAAGAGANTYDSNQVSINGPREVATAPYGWSGTFSSDWIEFAPSGRAFGDMIQLQVGVEEYMVVATSGNYLALRTV